MEVLVRTLSSEFFKMLYACCESQSPGIRLVLIVGNTDLFNPYGLIHRLQNGLSVKLKCFQGSFYACEDVTQC